MESSISPLKEYEVNLSTPSKQEVDKFKSMLASSVETDEIYKFLKDNPSILLYLTFTHEASYVIPDIILNSEINPCILIGNLYPRGYVWNLIAFSSPQIKNISENQQLISDFQSTINAVRLWDKDHPSILTLKSKLSAYWLSEIKTGKLNDEGVGIIDVLPPEYTSKFTHHTHRSYILVGQKQHMSSSTSSPYKHIRKTYGIIPFGYDSMLELRSEEWLSEFIKKSNDQREYEPYKPNDESSSQNVTHFFNPTEYTSTSLDERIKEWLSYIITRPMKDRTRTKQNGESGLCWYYAFELDKAFHKNEGMWDAEHPELLETSILDEVIIWLRVNKPDNIAQDFHDRVNTLINVATEYDNYLESSHDKLEDDLKYFEDKYQRNILIDNWTSLAEPNCMDLQIIAGSLINYIRTTSRMICQKLINSGESAKIISMPQGLKTNEIQLMIDELQKHSDNTKLASGSDLTKHKDSANKKPPKLHEHWLKAWILRDTVANNQREIAEFLNHEYGTKYTQGQVSRMLAKVEEYAEFFGLDELKSETTKLQHKVITMDPNKIELGQRNDHLSNEILAKEQQKAKDNY